MVFAFTYCLQLQIMQADNFFLNHSLVRCIEKIHTMQAKKAPKQKPTNKTLLFHFAIFPFS